ARRAAATEGHLVVHARVRGIVHAGIDQRALAEMVGQRAALALPAARGVAAHVLDAAAAGALAAVPAHLAVVLLGDAGAARAVVARRAGRDAVAVLRAAHATLVVRVAHVRAAVLGIRRAAAGRARAGLRVRRGADGAGLRRAHGQRRVG